MAAQAEHRLGLGRELVNRQQGFEVAGLLLCDVLDGHAAGAVTRFAVHQRQTGFLGDLVAVDRMLEVTRDPVVNVALGQAVVVTDVIGFEVAHQDGLVIPDGCYRL